MRPSQELKDFAAKMWQSFTAQERTLVRFGMFPAEKMQAAERAGFTGKDLSCAIMDCAKQDGGMIA